MDAMTTLRDSEVPMAFVHDEYGHFEGLVTPGNLLTALPGRVLFFLSLFFLLPRPPSRARAAAAAPRRRRRPPPCSPPSPARPSPRSISPPLRPSSSATTAAGGCRARCRPT